jgi:hypothetical protein
MHPIKLTIEGPWWDSYIYAGELYLVRDDGSILVVPWPRLIDHVVRENRLDPLAAELAFVDSRSLYGDQWARLVTDRDVAAVLDGKFKRLSSESLIVSEATLNYVESREIGNVAPELVADLEMYRSMMYFAAEDGLWAQRKGRALAREPSAKVWDTPIFRVRANRGVIALAAGAEGLFQASAFGSRVRSLPDDDPLVIGNFFSCAWVGANIYGTSYENAGTLALFSQQRDPTRRVVHRRYEAAIPGDAVFDEGAWETEWTMAEKDAALSAVTDLNSPDGSSTATGHALADAQIEGGATSEMRFERSGAPVRASQRRNGLSWGGQEHVCITTDDGIRIAQYSQRKKHLRNRFTTEPTLRLDLDGVVIGGDVAPFGIVVETPRDLFVGSSSGRWNAGYEPARWRTFGRATNYPNHLHIVAEHGLEIWSFLTDHLASHRRNRLMGRSRL